MKKFLFGMAALVSVSLIFLGCPTESDDSPGYSPEQAAAELAVALGADKVTVNGATVTLTADVTIDAGTTATVGSGVTLDVAANKTLTVNGAIDNSGNIEVSGTYIVPAPTGDISRGSNNGTVTVKSGGTLESYANLDGTGTNTVEAGGKVAFKKTGAEGSTTPKYIAGSSGDSPELFVLNAGTDGGPTGGTFTFGNGFYILGGSVSVNATWVQVNEGLIITKDVSFSLAENAVLTIPNGKMLTLKNSTDGDTTAHWFLGASGAKVVVAGTAANAGALWFDNRSSGGADIRNFYGSDGTTSAATTQTDTTNIYAVTAGTYVWSDTAGGTDKPGWKAEAVG
jgi:hypothetical protein